MKTLFGALALTLAVPAAAQTAPAQNPHAGHAQHGSADHKGMQHHGMSAADHARMMEECKSGKATGKAKEHCEAMMKAMSAAPAPKADAHEGHAH